MIATLANLFNLIDNTAEQVSQALEIDGPDFEDTLQYVAAKEKKCDYIITRDKKGFSNSDIPVYSPKEFLKIISEI